MYYRVRKKMTGFIISAILLLAHPLETLSNSVETSTTLTLPQDEGLDKNIIDFDEEYTVKFNKKYGTVPWHSNDFDRNTHKYTIIKSSDKNNDTKVSYNPNNTRINNNTNVRYNPYGVKDTTDIREETTTEDLKIIPLELANTTENALVSLIDSTTEQDLTVIPLYTTFKLLGKIEQTVTLTTTTEYDGTTDISETTTISSIEQSTSVADSNEEVSTTWEPVLLKTNITKEVTLISTILPRADKIKLGNEDVTEPNIANILNDTKVTKLENIKTPNETESESIDFNTTKIISSKSSEAENRSSAESKEEDIDVPVFTELDTEDFEDIPEDYYDSKDVLPTSTPKTDAISVLFGLAGSVVESVVESVAERVVPKSIYDLFKRMQRQNEALEAEKLRSREENGGIGQFGRGILKSLSNGLGRPLSQLMAGVKEAGSLDTDRGFVGNVAASVSSVANAANTYLEAFKDKVQAIYPGTVWCGDGRSAQARSSSDLGLFFFTDTCCRQHDACKIYIKAGETKYGLTNTGLFTRSHCSCDAKFRACLRRTSSLVSAQIGLTYFNVLGPQCFRRAHPIVKCSRRTRLTGLKCEEYELDYTKKRMWQWFDNETF